MKNGAYRPDVEFMRKFLAASVLKMLEESGFTEEESETTTVMNSSGPWGYVDASVIKERVFFRTLDKHPSIQIKVYTTIEKGSNQTRGAGDDSIRVCAIYTTKDGNSKGIVKASRVHRCGTVPDIVERVRNRMREVWKKANVAERCSSCGAPKFTSKKGNPVCAELCWLSDEEKNRPWKPTRRRRRWKR